MPRCRPRDSIARWHAGDKSNNMRTTEIDQPHKDGNIVHTEVVTTLHADALGNPTSVLGVTRDVTERKRTEDAIRHLAFYDGLTQLPNRRLLLDRLRLSIARAARDSSRVALLFVDLDNFKPVNDELGHQVGDWLLQSAAKRMVECLRPYDTAARIGGDEFVILLPDLRHTDEGLAIGERIRSAMQQHFLTPDAKRIRVSTSIGVAIFPDHARTERDLLRAGDEAMYQAKKSGRNSVVMLPANAVVTDTQADTIRSGGPLLRLNWSPAYNSGDATIDSEHREMFRFANVLLEKTTDPDAEPAEVKQAYEFLITTITKHFRDEEAQMRAWNYPKLQEHAQMHQKLLERSAELRQHVDDQTLAFGELVEFVALDVVARHMLKHDRDYYAMVGLSAHARTELGSQPRAAPSRPGSLNN